MGLPVAAIGGLIQGGANIIGSLIGGGKRRREAKAAAAEYAAQRQSLMDTQFTNPYAGLENTAEDLTINQQAAQFQAQQTDAALAQSMQAAVASGGASGGAQAIAQAALQSKQGIAASIAKEESRNQMLRAQQAANLQNLEAQGQEDLQVANYEKNQDLLKMASARKQQADAARAAATKQLMGGIGQIAGGVAQGGFGGGSGGSSIASGGLSSSGFQSNGLTMPNLTGNPFSQFLQ